MAKGYQEMRLGQDGRWNPTGQLRDAGQWPPPDRARQLEVPFMTGRDTDNKNRIILLMDNAPIKTGTIAWAQFSRA